jgi:hypothetical protein
MSMVTVTVMATTTIAMINHCLFYDCNGTIAAIIYFSFLCNKNEPEKLWVTKGMEGRGE